MKNNFILSIVLLLSTQQTLFAMETEMQQFTPSQKWREIITDIQGREYPQTVKTFFLSELDPDTTPSDNWSTTVLSQNYIHLYYYGIPQQTSFFVIPAQQEETIKKLHSILKLVRNTYMIEYHRREIENLEVKNSDIESQFSAAKS